MKNSKYSIFSKEELIDFLDNYESRFKSIFSVYRILIQKRIDNIHEEMKKNILESARIADIIKNTNDIEKKYEQIKKYKDKDKKWKKLNNELKDLYEKLNNEIMED